MKINLDREREIKYTLNDLALIKRQIGKDVSRGADWQQVGVEDLQYIIWVGLNRCEPTLTLEETGNLVLTENLVETIGSVLSALGLRKPEAPEADRPTLPA